MRDDQIRLMIAKEIAHHDNIVMLRNQQCKIRIDAISEAVASPMTLLVALFIPGFLQKRMDEIYTEKAKAYNAKLKANIEAVSTKEKLKI